MSTELKPACGWPHCSEQPIVDIRQRQVKRCVTEYAISGNNAAGVHAHAKAPPM
ncbi:MULTISPECIES: hypothetical protein [unclassified Pseudomonas]|uniref:hypothetical protein n=1 Tax=unclassified Pseudomonas TaxID=196821 RepID=UPI0012DE2D45|nr:MULTISPECIES: hypothetical protein [unclassified Pseudomonas]MBD9400031.1 hypothetical protein [Pseudomonas sp. PDM11]